MAKPLVHAQSSAKRYGGRPEDYLEVHDFMDSSKSAFPDNRHRALTHNSWFIFIVEKVFGHTITVNLTDDGKTKQVHTRDIAEQHILEDFGGKYIPTVSDYLEGMEFHSWMNNGVNGSPTSHRKMAKLDSTTKRQVISFD